MAHETNPLVEPFGPLFATLPLEKAMPHLLLKGQPSNELRQQLEGLKPFYPNPGLQAGLWLYGDFFAEAHAIAQDLETPIGSYWHSILHRREGDFWNSKYWLKRARTIELDLPLDSFALIDRVERSDGQDVPELVKAQRAEWLALFTYCLQAGPEELGGVEGERC